MPNAPEGIFVVAHDIYVLCGSAYTCSGALSFSLSLVYDVAHIYTAPGYAEVLLSLSPSPPPPSCLLLGYHGQAVNLTARRAQWSFGLGVLPRKIERDGATTA